MRINYQLGVLFLLALCLLGCQEKESPLLVGMTVNGLDWKTESLEGSAPYLLSVKVKSNTSTVRKVSIITYDNYSAATMVMDSLMEDPLKSVELLVPYTTGAYPEMTTVSVKAIAYSNDGEQMSYTITLCVKASEERLNPIDNITLYSAASGKASYFSLDTKSVFLGDSTTTGNFFYDVPSEVKDSMSHIWKSPNLLFSRFQSFDYSAATVASVRNAYLNSKHDHVISSINSDDIILVGRADTALGVMKVVYIVDETGSANDRYVFSLKAIDSVKK